MTIMGYNERVSAFLIISFLISLVGALLGGIGLKSTKKVLAMTGMGLCIINLLGVILYYLVIKGLSESM